MYRKLDETGPVRTERRRRRGDFGPPFGGPGPWGQHGRGRGRRMKRGNVRAAILALLAERPMHGYEMIQELDNRTDGVWRPSPGSVYPTLQMLEDEGLITGQEEGGKRLFALTDKGREEAGAQPAAPWDEVAQLADASTVKAREEIGHLMAALHQVMHAGSPGQKTKALGLVADTRRRLYGILADDSPAE